MSNLVDSLASPLFRRAMFEAVLIALIAAPVGVHVLMRKLPFFVAAMSHATFPGIAIASAMGISLFIGGTVFGFVVVAAVLLLGANRLVDDSSVIGVVLAGSFALGVLVVASRPGSSTELTSFLVGSVLTVDRGDVVITVVVGLLVLIVLAGLHKELVLSAFDPRATAALGYRSRLLDASVLCAVTVTMVTAVPAVGTLLAIALLTVPALSARLWTDRVVPMMAVAGVIGGLSAVAGLCASAIWSIAAGGAIALATTAGFAISFVLSTMLRRPVRSAGAVPGTA